MEKQNILNDFDKLPPEAQKQVIDFIAFLQTRYQSISDLKKNKPKAKFTEEAFIGIWRNREDMQDSSAWVRRIRASEWG
jgi:hypothetical protein